ncbi:tetrahydrobiopterin biosynthesis enzymes-like protein [Phlegmacium glaucopus]|nr:tetrahydrobiopterin biosynthesis enzymes-like protein [Phlegmacium glaucopus]
MANSLPPASDVIFVDSLHVSANIGPDCWDRDRPQPIDISIYLHLKESYLDKAGASDNVSDSIDYSALTKKVSNFIKAKSESETPGFGSPDELIKAVTERAFELTGEAAAAAVRVIVGAPKMILLAEGFSVDITTVNNPSKSIAIKQVLIKDLILPVIIGVNPAERKSKQRVKINIIFHEDTSLSSSSTVVNYQQVVAQLCQEIESSSYLTLETFVMQILKTSCMCSDRIEAVTARAQKPSALSFAESSGVEISRRRNFFVR